MNQEIFKHTRTDQKFWPRDSLLEDGLNSSSAYMRQMDKERQFDNIIAEAPVKAVLRGLQNFSEEDWQTLHRHFTEALEDNNHAEKSDLAKDSASMLLIKLIETLPADYISQLLHHSQLELSSETDAGRDETINAVIEGLETSPGKDPKLYRSALQLFRERKGVGVYFDELKKSGINAQNEDAAVHNLVHRLDEKLRLRGYKIRRRSVYDIAPIDEEMKE